MLIREVLKIIFVLVLIICPTLSNGDNSGGASELVQNAQQSSPPPSPPNDTLTFEFDFDLQRFMIRFVLEHIVHHAPMNVSQACLDKWMQLRANLIRSYYDSIENKSNYWSLKVIDSYGKSPSGFLKNEGAFFWAGDYFECIQIKDEGWNGKYCLLDTGLIGPNTHYSKVFKVGMCMPEQCAYEDVVKLVDKGYELMPKYMRNLLASHNKSVECKQKEKSLNAKAIVAITILSIILFLVFVSTVVEVVHLNMKHLNALIPKLGSKKKNSNEDIVNSESNISVEQSPKKEIEKEDGDENSATKQKKKTTIKQKSMKLAVEFFSSFSIYSNLKIIFNTKPHPLDIECLHAIRFISQCWIIISHSYFYMLPLLENTEYYTNLNEHTSNVFYNAVSQISHQGYLAVDTFLVMNGILTSYIGLKTVYRENFKFNPLYLIKFYMHRYLRLTPAYMIIFMIHVTLSPYFGQGPMYPRDGFETNRCSNDWWTHLLYINNLVMVDDCFGHSWYLACEMQITILMPFLLYFFKIKIWKTNLGILSSALLIVANIVSIFTISFVSNLDYKIYDHFIYIAPWSRMGASIIGALFGYFLFHFKRNQKVLVIKKLMNVLLWVFSIAIMLTIILFFNYIPTFTLDLKKKILGSLYQSVFRLIWSCCLSFMIFSCATSNGGVISRMSTWSIWRPLSKLTYSTYIAHVSVIYFVIYISDRPSHKVEFETGAFFISNVVYAYIIGLLVAVLFELPFELLGKRFIISQFERKGNNK